MERAFFTFLVRQGIPVKVRATGSKRRAVLCQLRRRAQRRREAVPLCGVRVVLPPSLRSNAAASRSLNNRTSPRAPSTRASGSRWSQSSWPFRVDLRSDQRRIRRGLTWSLYVVAGLGTVWVWCISPFLYHRNIVPLWIATDAAALIGLLYVIDALSPSPGWFAPLALPIALTQSVLTLLIVTFARRRILRDLHIVAATLLALGALCVVVGGGSTCT